MPEVKLSKEELLDVKRAHQEIMSYASVGLFYKSGEFIGKSMAAKVKKEKYFEELSKILKEKGWVKEIEFGDELVKVKGSIEVHPSKVPTCDLLRGVIRGIYETRTQSIVKVEEIKCESVGDEYCVFKIRRVR